MSFSYFTQVYRPITGGAVVDRTTSDAYPNFPKVLSGSGPGTIYAVVSDGARAFCEGKGDAVVKCFSRRWNFLDI